MVQLVICVTAYSVSMIGEGVMSAYNRVEL